MDCIFKFGAFGVFEGQFAEPRGLAVNAGNDIIVADTRNHRIQIFDRQGQFKFQFGGYRQGYSLMMYPHRVAVSRTNGNIIVLQRSPSYQILLYDMFGHFLIRSGETLNSSAQAVTVDSEGKIIVVDCMWLNFFNQYGFNLTETNFKHKLDSPNGVVVSEQKEIFISESTTHCVKVFNYDGQCFRQIGGESITKNPFGVCLTSLGDIVIGRKTGDNRDNLTLTFFTKDGALVSQHTSKVKHVFCFDMATMDDGSVVVSSHDCSLYVYRCT